MKIIRMLVEEGPNDIFMAGDENQKATVKSRSFSSSVPIYILPENVRQCQL